MNRKVIGVLIGFVVLMTMLGGIVAWRKWKREGAQSAVTIGILQTASHPALDAARKGFIENMREALGNEVRFIDRNAQGSVTNAHAIASSFHSRSDIDAIFAIATPAVKAMASVERDKPIIIAAVTDPYALGIMHDKTNVTGSSDMVNVAELVEVINMLVPQAKRVGILFNLSEVNSAVLVKKMEEQLSQRGYDSVRLGVTNESELAPVLDTGLRNIDVLLVPTDNTVASAITFVAERAVRAQVPLIVSDNLLVDKGALAARGIDYVRSGQNAADAALLLVQGEQKPYEIPLIKPERGKIFVNKRILDLLGLTIPASLVDDVHLVEADSL